MCISINDDIIFGIGLTASERRGFTKTTRREERFHQDHVEESSLQDFFLDLRF